MKVVLPYSAVGVCGVDHIAVGVGGDRVDPYPLPAGSDGPVDALEGSSRQREDTGCTETEHYQLEECCCTPVHACMPVVSVSTREAKPHPRECNTHAHTCTLYMYTVTATCTCTRVHGTTHTFQELPPSSADVELLAVPVPSTRCQAVLGGVLEPSSHFTRLERCTGTGRGEHRCE